MTDIIPSLIAFAFIAIGIAAIGIALAAKRIRRTAHLEALNADLERRLKVRKERRLNPDKSVTRATNGQFARVAR